MTFASQQPVTIGTSSRPARDQGRGVGVLSATDASFGTFLAGAGVALFALPSVADLSLPDVRSSFSELGQSPRDRRLKTLRQGAAGTLDADSRIAGATRAAHDHAVQAAGRDIEPAGSASGSTATSPSKPQESAASHAATDGQRVLSAPRVVASQSGANSCTTQPGSNPFEKGADASGQTVTPSGSSRGTQPPAAAPATLESPRASQTAPTRSVSNVVRDIPASRPARGGSGQPAPNGAQPSGGQASQARGKVGDVMTRALESAPEPARVGRADQREPRPGELIERIARIVHARAGGKETVARIQLDPPELGRVRIGIRLHNETLQLRLAAETVEGRKSLQSHISELRAVLEQQGICVQRIDLPAPASGETADPTLAGDAGDSSASQGDTDPSWRRESDVSGALDTSKGVPTPDGIEEIGQPPGPESSVTPVGLDVRV